MITAGLVKPRVRPAPLFALTSDQTLRALIVTAYAVCGGLMVMQDDSWWHLRCGKLIVESGAVPLTDPFSFTFPGAHWPNHEWLAQALMYAVYYVGGLPGLNLLGALVAGATGMMLIAAMSGPMERRLILCLLILPWFVAAMSARPQIFTLLGLATTLALLSRDRLWPLPPLFLLWANLHGAVALGGLLMVVALGATLAFERSRFPRLLFVTVLCGGATLLTPLGTELLLFPLHSVGRLKQLGLSEWMAPGFRQWEHLYFWALLLVFLVWAGIRVRRARRWNARLFTTLAVVFSLLAIMSARNIPLFLIVASVAASWLMPINRRRPLLDYSRKNGATVTLSIGATVGVLFMAYSTPWQRLDWRPLSNAAIAALRECPQRLFTTYNTGGYVLWFTPERQVFVDSRQDPYPIEFLRDVCATQRSGDYAAFFQQHDVQAAFVETHWPLANRLLEDGWRPLYRDDRWLIALAPASSE